MPNFDWKTLIPGYLPHKRDLEKIKFGTDEDIRRAKGIEQARFDLAREDELRRERDLAKYIYLGATKQDDATGRMVPDQALGDERWLDIKTSAPLATSATNLLNRDEAIADRVNLPERAETVSSANKLATAQNRYGIENLRWRNPMREAEAFNARQRADEAKASRSYALDTSAELIEPESFTADETAKIEEARNRAMAARERRPTISSAIRAEASAYPTTEKTNQMRLDELNLFTPEDLKNQHETQQATTALKGLLARILRDYPELAGELNFSSGSDLDYYRTPMRPPVPGYGIRGTAPATSTATQQPLPVQSGPGLLQSNQPKIRGYLGEDKRR